jgi:hypothetical protein
MCLWAYILKLFFSGTFKLGRFREKDRMSTIVKQSNLKG